MDKLIVAILSGCPLVITDQYPIPDIWVDVWLPGSEGRGVPDVFLGDYPCWQSSFDLGTLEQAVAHQRKQRSPENRLFCAALTFGYGRCRTQSIDHGWIVLDK